jgi:multicomponent Na+:H+ antiporter subunit A
LTGTRRGRVAGRVAGWASVGFAVAAVVALLVWRSAGGAGVDTAWLPTYGARIALGLDGLAAAYALLAAVVGVAVFTYATAYLPLHLDHQGRRRTGQLRFFALLALFLATMVGLATAQDLLLLFVFWDLTAVVSYLLIGFDRHRREARLSALMALLVTAVSAVLMVIGILMLRDGYGTLSIPELVSGAAPSGELTVAMVLITVGALAKSAQVPFHFWLPRAMAAPTPVSAYLHSAAMVAAGVLVLSRLHPLLERADGVLPALIAVGLASMTVGGVLALAVNGLKRVLAYSTIAQYGYVVTMLGIGGEAGAAGACFYVLVHGLAKSALFMTAGAVTEATGGTALTEVGGLARRMPWLAAGSGVAAAGLAALPLTAGFFKDELFFAAAAGHSAWLGAAAVASAALTFGYLARFWTGVFLGPAAEDVRRVPVRMVAPVVALGGLVVLGGLWVAPFSALAGPAATVTAATAVDVHPAYHLDARVENLMALGAYAGGALLVWARPRLERLLALLRRLGELAGPERGYVTGLAGLNRLSNAIHDVEVRDLRGRLVAVLVPAGLLVGIGVGFTPFEGAYRVGSAGTDDLPLVAALVAAAAAALAVARLRRHLSLVLALSGVGFSLAVAYSLLGAPDVALVAVLIETLFMLLFVAVFARLPRQVLDREAALPVTRSRRIRDPLVGVVSGVIVLLVVWAGLSRPVPADPSADRQVALTEQAHGKDVVTVILADFRGLDTMVEITVVFVAMLGVATLLRRGRLW